MQREWKKKKDQVPVYGTRARADWKDTRKNVRDADGLGKGKPSDARRKRLPNESKGEFFFLEGGPAQGRAWSADGRTRVEKKPELGRADAIQ